MTNETSQDEHLTPDELVKRWRDKVSRGTLTQWRYKKKGPFFTKIGRAVLYPLDAVRRYELENFSGTDTSRAATH